MSAAAPQTRLVGLIPVEGTFLPQGQMRQISQVTALDGPHIEGGAHVDGGHWVYRDHFLQFGRVELFAGEQHVATIEVVLAVLPPA